MTSLPPETALGLRSRAWCAGPRGQAKMAMRAMESQAERRKSRVRRRSSALSKKIPPSQRRASSLLGPSGSSRSNLTGDHAEIHRTSVVSQLYDKMKEPKAADYNQDESYLAYGLLSSNSLSNIGELSSESYSESFSDPVGRRPSEKHVPTLKSPQEEPHSDAGAHGETKSEDDGDKLDDLGFPDLTSALESEALSAALARLPGGDQREELKKDTLPAEGSATSWQKTDEARREKRQKSVISAFMKKKSFSDSSRGEDGEEDGPQGLWRRGLSLAKKQIAPLEQQHSNMDMKKFSMIRSPVSHHGQGTALWNEIARSDSRLPAENPTENAAWKITPDHWFLQYWLPVTMLLVLFDVIWLPIDIAFEFEESRWLTCIDSLVDIAFIVDILLSTRTVFKDEEGKWVTDSEDIMWNYAHNGLLVDVLAAIPFELLYLLSSIALNATQTSRLRVALRWCKLVRLARMGRLFIYIQRNIDGFDFSNLWRLIKLFLIFTLVAHWLGCGWFLLCKYEHFTLNNLDNWFVVIPLEKQAWKLDVTRSELSGQPAFEKYYNQLFYIGFLFYIGEDLQLTNSLERTYAIFALFFGALCYATLFGQMSLIIANFSKTATRYQEMMGAVNEHLRDLKVREARCVWAFPTQFHERDVTVCGDYTPAVSSCVLASGGSERSRARLQRFRLGVQRWRIHEPRRVPRLSVSRSQV